MPIMFAAPAMAQLVSAQINYPPAELKASIQGIAGFEVELTKNGKVVRCRVTQTSGNADFDKQTCVQLRETGEFKPAIDSTGRPIKSIYASKMRWTIPHSASEVRPASPQQ